MIKIDGKEYGMWPDYVYHDRTDSDQETYDKLICGCRTMFTGGHYSPGQAPDSYCELHKKRYAEWIGCGGMSGGICPTGGDINNEDGMYIYPDNGDYQIIPWEDVSDQYINLFIYAKQPRRHKVFRGEERLRQDCQCRSPMSGGPTSYFVTGLSESCNMHMPRYKEWLGMGKNIVSEHHKPIEQRDESIMEDEHNSMNWL